MLLFFLLILKNIILHATYCTYSSICILISPNIRYCTYSFYATESHFSDYIFLYPPHSVVTNHSFGVHFFIHTILQISFKVLFCIHAFLQNSKQTAVYSTTDIFAHVLCVLFRSRRRRRRNAGRYTKRISYDHTIIS